MIIPGGQALLGFQFIATLTKAFAELPYAAQISHLAGLCAVALAVTLLMTPAALHLIAFDGEDSARFYKLPARSSSRPRSRLRLVPPPTSGSFSGR